MTSAISAEKRDIIELPLFFQEMQSIHAKTGFVVDIATALVGAFDSVTGKVSAVVRQIFGAMAFTGGFHAVFAIPRIINSIGRAVQASTVVDRVKNAFYAALDVGAVWAGVSSILNGLRSVSVLTAEALSWTSIVNAALFPLQLISVGLDVHQLSETRSQRSAILANIGPYGVAKYRISDLTKACKYVADNEEHLLGALRLSKAIKLAERANSLFDRLTSSNEKQVAKTEATDFIKILRRRINTKYNLEVATLAVKVSAVVAGGVSVFVPPNPVTIAVAGVCGVTSIILAGLDSLLMNEDPFLAPKDIWYQKLAHKVRAGFGQLTDALEGVSARVSTAYERCLRLV